jgi:hypothetical protein
MVKYISNYNKKYFFCHEYSDTNLECEYIKFKPDIDAKIL